MHDMITVHDTILKPNMWCTRLDVINLLFMIRAILFVEKSIERSNLLIQPLPNPCRRMIQPGRKPEEIFKSSQYIWGST